MLNELDFKKFPLGKIHLKDFDMLVPEIEDTLVKNMTAKRGYEPYITKLFKDLLSEGDTVIDIGSAFGYYTVLSSKIVGESGRVISIEPHPVNHHILKSNVSLNDCEENVELMNVAASDHYGKVEFGVNVSTNFGHSGIDVKGDYKVTVPTIALGDLIDSKVKLLKSDTEGHELPIFRSIGEKLEKVENIIFEFHKVGDSSIFDLWELLQAHGFEIVRQTGAEYEPTGKEKMGNFWARKNKRSFDEWFASS